MLWAVRGTSEQTGQDVTMVVEADSQVEAEYMGRRRGLPVIIVEEATAADIRTAKAAKLYFSAALAQPLTCLGRPVGQPQIFCLLVSGIALILLLLHKLNIPLPLHF